MGQGTPTKQIISFFVVLNLIKTEGEIDSKIFQSFLHPLSNTKKIPTIKKKMIFNISNLIKLGKIDLLRNRGRKTGLPKGEPVWRPLGDAKFKTS